MNQLFKGIANFVKNDEGVTMVEYGLLAALIAVACVGIITTLGTNLNGIFTTVSNCLQNKAC